jgi:hypothetical protein
VLQIVDELATTPESMPSTSKGNGNNEPSTTTYLEHENIDEHLVRLQDACQLLYQRTHSTKFATTMLLMNICTIHGVSNKCVDELLSLL